MSALNAALDLAARGIPVFPCLASKAPACAGGFKAATTDPAGVRALFADGGPLIGVPTGQASGLDVLDLDPRHGSEAWWQEHSECLPATRTHRTRSGGTHMLFKHRPGLRCSAGTIAPGVDVRSDGGYVVWHPAAGFPVLADLDPAPWPAWLVPALLRGPASADTANPARPDMIAPPSTAAVADLLNRLPNPIAVGRDEYARVMLAAAWCARASADDAGVIEDAAVAWAERWEGGGVQDERAKWESDWSTRTAPLAGWQTLVQVARRLIPGYLDPGAGVEFDAVPSLVSRPSRRVIAPGECDGVAARPYLVKGMLADRDVGCLFGPPGAGKSLLAPLLAYKLARGETFFGLRTRAGPTLYVAAEDESGMERRVNALRVAHGDAPGFGLVAGVSDLLNPSSGDLAWLRSEVERRKPALIVIDTLAMAFPGLMENDADAMGRVVAVARQLTAYGAAVLLVHHDSKARDGTPRGHSLLNGALDVAIALEPKDAAGVVRGRLTKNRNGSCEHDIAFRIGVQALGLDEDGDPITAAIAVELSADETTPRLPKLSPFESAALAKVPADGVAEDTWIDQCSALSGAATVKDRARGARNLRARLTAKGLIRTEGGTIFLAGADPLLCAIGITRGSGQSTDIVERIRGDHVGIITT